MFDLLKLKKRYEHVKILIVDDEPNIVQTLKDRLEMNGYSISTAGNGAEGLETALRIRPDIILLDIIMPVMDGHEMLAALKERRECTDISVIMVTAKNETSDIARARSLGIDDYIVKPFELSELIGKIENVVESRRTLSR